MAPKLIFDSKKLRAGFQRDLVDEVLPLVCKGETLEKAVGRGQPVTIQGSAVQLFEAIFIAFRRHLQTLFAGAEFESVLGKLLDPGSFKIDQGPPLKVDWRPGVLEEFHKAADAEIGQPLAHDVAEDVLKAIATIYLAGRSAAGRTIQPSAPDVWNTVSQTAVNVLQKQTLFWIGTAYSREITGAINRTISGIVARGLSPAEGRDALKEKLAETFQRTDSYWYLLAHAAMGRASNYGAMSRLFELEVETYEWVSVIDSATSEICRYMNGRVFRVQPAVDVMNKVLDADNPGVIRTVQPWIRFDRKRALAGLDALWKRNTKDGLPPPDPNDDLATRLYLPDSRFSLAGDHFDPLGNPNDMTVNVTLEQLLALMPPIHGRCRSNVVLSNAESERAAAAS